MVTCNWLRFLGMPLAFLFPHQIRIEALIPFDMMNELRKIKKLSWFVGEKRCNNSSFKLSFNDRIHTKCYASSTASLPGPAIPILSQVFSFYRSNS